MHAQQNGYFNKRRQDQELKIFFESIGEKLKDNFYNHPLVKKQLQNMKNSILNGQISSYQAGNNLLDAYYQTLKND
jgi:LAO/AO transport system kinase